MLVILCLHLPSFHFIVSMLWWIAIARSWTFSSFLSYLSARQKKEAVVETVCQNAARWMQSLSQPPHLPSTHILRRQTKTCRLVPMQSLMEWLAHSSGFGNTGSANLDCSSAHVCARLRFEWLACMLSLLGPCPFIQWLWVHFLSSSSIWLAWQVIRNTVGTLQTGKLWSEC